MTAVAVFDELVDALREWRGRLDRASVPPGVGSRFEVAGPDGRAWWSFDATCRGGGVVDVVVGHFGTTVRLSCDNGVWSCATCGAGSCVHAYLVAMAVPARYRLAAACFVCGATDARYGEGQVTPWGGICNEHACRDRQLSTLWAVLDWLLAHRVVPTVSAVSVAAAWIEGALASEHDLRRFPGFEDVRFLLDCDAGGRVDAVTLVVPDRVPQTVRLR